MNHQLIFYTHPRSRGRTARWMLEECQLSYQTELLEYGTTMKSADYLRINPLGKVPALQHVFCRSAAGTGHHSQGTGGHAE
jgi:glutathione S-transferase